MRTALSRLMSIALLALIAGYGCGPVDEAPMVDSATAAQISGGLGFTVYHFAIEGRRVGTLLVTNGAEGGAYLDQTEYWRFDGDALKDLEDDAVDQLDVRVAKQSRGWSAKAVRRHFEHGTRGYVAWAVPRTFELAARSTRVRADDRARRTMLRMVDGEISYTLLLDFDDARAPTTRWFIDADALVALAGEAPAPAMRKGLLDLPRGIDPNNWAVELAIDRPLERVDAAHGFEMIPVAE